MFQRQSFTFDGSDNFVLMQQIDFPLLDTNPSTLIFNRNVYQLIKFYCCQFISAKGNKIHDSISHDAYGGSLYTLRQRFGEVLHINKQAQNDFQDILNTCERNFLALAEIPSLLWHD